MKDSVPGQRANGNDVCAIAVTYYPDSEFPARLSRILRQVSALVIVDNGSGEAEIKMLRELAANPSITLVLNLDNLGIATALNIGIQRATTLGFAWVLLLDQDTLLSSEYLTEMLDATDALASMDEVGAVVPKLWAGTRLYSPDAPFLFQIRQQFTNENFAVDEKVIGMVTQPLTAYNSGAALRVSTMEEIGGFPEDFWLDYLDHAVFQQLQLHGHRLWVMRTVLQQNLSHMDLDAVPMSRHWSVLAAQTRFVLRFGGASDRIFFRWWLLKTSRTYLFHCGDKRVWRMRAVQAFRLKQMPPRYPEGQHA